MSRRTSARKSSIGGIYVCARGLDIEDLIKKLPLIHSFSYFNLVGLVALFGD